jgi:hypothetical protein
MALNWILMKPIKKEEKTNFLKISIFIISQVRQIKNAHGER